MKTSALLTRDLMHRLHAAGLTEVSFTQAEILRRAQLTLHRWAELECGDGDNYKSWAIERDEETGVPYMVEHMHVTASPGGSLYSNHGTYRTKIADRETGAIRRVAETCADIGAHWYHQGDPRGCALYVAAEPLTDSDYSRGVACC